MLPRQTVPLGLLSWQKYHQELQIYCETSRGGVLNIPCRCCRFGSIRPLDAFGGIVSPIDEVRWEERTS
jgi:hypothetical protein